VCVYVCVCVWCVCVCVCVVCGVCVCVCVFFQQVSIFFLTINSRLLGLRMRDEIWKE